MTFEELISKPTKKRYREVGFYEAMADYRNAYYCTPSQYFKPVIHFSGIWRERMKNRYRFFIRNK